MEEGRRERGRKMEGKRERVRKMEEGKRESGRKMEEEGWIERMGRGWKEGGNGRRENRWYLDRREQSAGLDSDKDGGDRG